MIDETAESSDSKSCPTWVSRQEECVYVLSRLCFRPLWVDLKVDGQICHRSEALIGRSRADAILDDADVETVWLHCREEDRRCSSSPAGAESDTRHRAAVHVNAVCLHACEVTDWSSTSRWCG